MQPRYRSIALLFSLLSLLLAVAACRREETATPAPVPTSTVAAVQPTAPPATSASSSAPTQTSAPAQAAAPTQAPSAAKAAVSASTSVPQTLRVNLGDFSRTSGSEPESIDPAKLSFGPEMAVVMLAYENLLGLDPQAKLIPAAAEAMPSISPDGLVYTFKLRDGLKYSDGQPLRAKDFEYSWKRHLSPELASATANYGYVVKGAQAYNTADRVKVSQTELQKLRDAVGVKALDDRTLQFTLEQPSAYFVSLLTS